MKIQIRNFFLNTALLLSMFLFNPTLSLAQIHDNNVWQVITINGNEYHGKLISKSDSTVVLETKNLGTITIKVDNIKKIIQVEVKNIVGDQVWMDNPQESRYFWAPSGYGLKKGEAYYQNVWLFFNQVAVGVTDNFSIGAGIVPIFLFGGSSSPIWITPKFSFYDKEESASFGVGGLFGTVTGEEDSSFGIVYGSATVGNRNKNFTFGLGYGYVGDDWASHPTLSFSGMIRTGKQGYFITESYFVSASDESLGLIGLGGRRIFNSVSLDYGGIIPIGGDGFGIIPWLGLVVSFGK